MLTNLITRIWSFEIFSLLNFISPVSSCQLKSFELNVPEYVSFGNTISHWTYILAILSLYNRLFFGSCIAQPYQILNYIIIYFLGISSSTGTTLLWWNVIRVPQQITFIKHVMELNLKDHPINLIWDLFLTPWNLNSHPKILLPRYDF